MELYWCRTKMKAELIFELLIWSPFNFRKTACAGKRLNFLARSIGMLCWVVQNIQPLMWNSMTGYNLDASWQLKLLSLSLILVEFCFLNLMVTSVGENTRRWHISIFFFVHHCPLYVYNYRCRFSIGLNSLWNCLVYLN